MHLLEAADSTTLTDSVSFMVRRPLRVFLSCSSELSTQLRDLARPHSFVEAAASAIGRAGHASVHMSTWTAADASAAVLSAKRVASCNVYVGVLGFRYGSLLPDGSRSYTELEFDTATTRRIPRLVFLVDENPDVALPATFFGDQDDGERQRAFRRKVEQAGLVRATAKSPAQLETLVYQALVEHDKGNRVIPHSPWVRALLVLLLLAMILSAAAAYRIMQRRPPTTVTLNSTSKQLVSSDGAGRPADSDSGRPVLDSTGRYVVFTSSASNLAGRPTHGHYNVYRKDRETGKIYTASVDMDGNPADGDSQFPIICPAGDNAGRYIAFASTATNLVAATAGAPPLWRVYVNDTVDHTTRLVSIGADGKDPRGDSRNPHFNTDCSEIAFESNSPGLTPEDIRGSYNVFVRYLHSDRTVLASADPDGHVLDGPSTHADIAPNGRTVAFTSWATDLQGASATRGPGVFLRDLATGRVTAVSAAMRTTANDIEGFSWPSFSADGRYLIFRSITQADDPSQRGRHVYVWDVTKGQSAIVSADGRTPTGWSDACVQGTNNGTNFAPEISGTGAGHPYRVLFTVPEDDACGLVLRDLAGNDIPLNPQKADQEILEPALNSSGDVIAWALAGQPQLVYACQVDHCA